MLRKWSRPSFVPFPNVWRTFHLKKENENGEEICQKVTVEDVPAHGQDDVIEFLKEHYMPDEPIIGAIRLMDDEQSLCSLIQDYRTYFGQNLCVFYILHENGQDDEDKVINENGPKNVKVDRKIIAASLLAVFDKDDPEFPQFPGKLYERHCAYYQKAEEEESAFHLLQTDQYLKMKVGCVHRDYRNLRLSREIFSHAAEIAKTFHIPAVMGNFSAIGAQKTAEKFGFKLYNRIEYELEKENDAGQIENIKCVITRMGKKYDH